MLLMPVIATRSDMNPVRYHAVFSRSTLLLFIALVAPLGTATSIGARTQPSLDRFDSLFARTLAKRQSIRSIRARFTETTISSLLEKPIVSHGTVIAAPPSRVLMTYTDPERRIVAIDGRSLVVEWPDRHERETIDISQTQKRIDQYVSQASPDQLRSMFDVTVQSDKALVETELVDMRPKRKQIKEGLERLELWIARESLLLVQMRLTFPGGDSKTIRLDDPELNVLVSEDTFRVRP